MITSYREKLHPEDKEATDLLALDANAFNFMLINSTQELSARDEQKQEDIEGLQTEVDTLKAQNEALKKVVCELKPGAEICR